MCGFFSRQQVWMKDNVKTVEITMVFDFTPKTTCTRTRRIWNEYVDVELFTTRWLIVFDMKLQTECIFSWVSKQKILKREVTETHKKCAFINCQAIYERIMHWPLSSWKLMTLEKIMTFECNIVRNDNMAVGYINLRIFECMYRKYTSSRFDEVSQL